ncbi:MAG TPA: ABC transporter permease subunit [Ktedonobacterales bacterium]|jgi:ABC-type transport system involved in multi-copper enzyme maturation permease subunit
MTTPTPATAATLPVAAPRANGDWLTLTLRLTRWNLFQMWRRLMSKILLGLLLGFFALAMLGLLLAFAASSGQSTQASSGIADLLTFPRSTALAVEYVAFFGVVFTCILTGAVVGGEYGFNTLRLALSRGIGRGQVIVAQTLALLALAFGTALGIALVGTLVGIIVGPLLGGTPEGLAGDGVTQLLGYIGATGLRIFTYTMIALLFATLTRSTAGGIGGALGFIVVELVALPIITVIITVQRAVALATHLTLPGYVDVLSFVRAVFIQTNADALVGAAREGPLSLNLAPVARQATAFLPTPPSAAQAFLVLLVWCGAAGALSYWLTRQRDVTD